KLVHKKFYFILFFEFDAPDAFISPQLFAVNPRGDMIYSVKIGMRLALDPDTREAVMILTNRLICRCSIRTGENKTFMIDSDITPDELRQSSDFYLLADNIAVLLTYNVENYQFSQHVLLLSDITENATVIMKRTMTLPALNSGLTVDKTIRTISCKPGVDLTLSTATFLKL
ncbi:unnamed protein product, partial [Angiostrongylus costaricensis]|uniref:VP13A n=1 Tax=Angiostrongylus costaricensis TaxID=334426 RepID=A0A0R3Q2M2_ANGCS